MKTLRKHKAKEESEMAEHYDFSKGTRPNYAKRFSDGAEITVHTEHGKTKKGRIEKRSIILLDADVSKIFKDSRSANEALRHVIAAFPQKRRKRS